VTLSTRQHAERRKLEAAPETVASEHTRQGFTGGLEGAITRTRDRQIIEVASRPEPPMPLTPEQEATRAAANAGLEMHARWKREDEERVAERARQKAIQDLKAKIIAECGLDETRALEIAEQRIRRMK
jgi:Tat protein secretion system quality control protein TatD with DNase activity